jgi:rhamnose transport system permease protein
VADWLRRRSWLALLGAFLAASVAYNVVESSGYVGIDNFVNLFELSIEKVIVVVAMTFVIVAGEIDLSVASVMVLAASVVASLHEAGTVPFAAAVAIALAASAAAGYLHGWIITRLGLPSLVVTLAGLIGWRGVARVLVEDRSIGGFPDWFERLGQSDLVGPVPFSILFFFALLAGGAVVLHRSELGRYVYVIGDNAEVARYSGIDVRRVRTALFVSSGLVSGIAGVLFAARLGGVRGDMAFGYELEIITIVLLGGVSIFGGSGRLSGVALGILIVLNVRNGLGLANVDGSTQTGVIGAILIASVLGQNLLARLEARAAPAAAGPRPGVEPAGAPEPRVIA